MHWKNLSNYDYLGAYSLEGIKELTLTIKEIKKERVTANGGNSEDCIVAYFAETAIGNTIVKPMVLNKTNCKTIEKMYNTGEIENWIGKPITIFATTTKFARDIVPCLRVKPEIPQLKCTECGKDIDIVTYNLSKAKYEVSLCSKECLEQHNNKNNKNNKK